MLFQTKYFGQIDCGEEERISFPDGLFGFEEEKEFLLLPFQGSGGTLLCFQSTATPALAFVVMDPFSLCPEYTPALRKAELQLFGVEDVQGLCFYVMCAVKHPVSASTVNLKCPVVIHPGTREARQLIMETEGYGMRHPLAEFGPREEAATVMSRSPSSRMTCITWLTM